MTSGNIPGGSQRNMVLFCVYNVFGGCRVTSKCKGEG